MVKLKEFTKEDWYGFAGCEAEKPLIGEVNFLVDDENGERKIEGLVIVDKDDITMYFETFDDLEDTDTYVFRLEVTQLAGKFIVEHMAETFDKKYLNGLGFICEGDLLAKQSTEGDRY